MNDDLAIRARGLSKDFGSLRAVDRLDLDVPRASIYGFLGPNGSGKSTTIRMLCGLLTPSAGSASVLGVTVPGHTADLKPRIGYMTQKFSLFGDMTVIENLEFIDVSSHTDDRGFDAVSYDLDLLLDPAAGTISGRCAMGLRALQAGRDAVVIDPVLDLDTAPWRTSTDSVIRLLHLIKAQHWILDTHTCRPCQRCRGAEETPAGCSGYRRQHQGRQPSRTGK